MQERVLGDAGVGMRRDVLPCPVRLPRFRVCRHKLDLAIEEKIFASNDLEDLRAETLRTERELRSNVEVIHVVKSGPI